MYLIILTLLMIQSAQSRNVGSNPYDEAWSTDQVSDIHDLVVDHVINEANKPISFRMQNPVSPFIGRIAELSELKWVQVDKKITVITGPRGVGKSELARKYAQEFKHDNTSSTIWIDATSHESFISSFKDLAATVGIKVENKIVLSLIREIIDYFSNRKTLFVFDNAADDNRLVNSIPKYIEQSSFIHAIITSRSDKWDPNFKLIRLNEFTKEESMELVKQNFQKTVTFTIDDNNVEKLLNALGFLPLTLSKAITYIEEQNILFPKKQFSVDEYIVEFQEKGITKEVVKVEIVTRPPNEDEIENFLSDKLKDEAKRFGDKVAGTATNAWEKASGGVLQAGSFLGDKVPDIASTAGDGIKNAAVHVADTFKNIFG